MNKQIKPPSAEQYARAKANLLAGYAPPTHSCMKCGWPVVKGYCCQTCGDTDPGSPKDES